MSKPEAPFASTDHDLPEPTRSQATRILSGVSHDKAFYFYSAQDAPTGVSAAGIGQFLERLGTIDIGSIEFHVPRGDFENWISMLGDEPLARQLRQLREGGATGEELRSRLSQAVKTREQQLVRVESGAADPKEEGQSPR